MSEAAVYLGQANRLTVEGVGKSVKLYTNHDFMVNFREFWGGGV